MLRTYGDGTAVAGTTVDVGDGLIASSSMYLMAMQYERLFEDLVDLLSKNLFASEEAAPVAWSVCMYR
jgi:hypothetical protein